MPYHIFINRESGNDNISVFYDEPTFVVIANKDDLPAIQCKRPITRYLSNHSFLQYTVIKNKLEDFLCHNLSSH